MTFPTNTIPNTFATQAGPIPLSQLDANFTAIQTSLNYSTTATKGANTARTSTATLSNDPDLVYAIPSAGTYRIDAYLYLGYSLGSVPAGGYALNLNYSGSFVSSFGGSTFFTNGGSTNQGNFYFIQSTQTTYSVSYDPSLNGSYASAFSMNGVLVATGTGTLGLAWAQAVSNANPTTLYAGSYLEVQRIL